MKLAYRVVEDGMAVLIYVTKANIEDGVRVKLPLGVRHLTAVQVVADVIAAANAAMAGQPKGD